MTESANRYLNNTYVGKKFLTRLNEYGVWRVTGGDPNCDLGGNHYSPFLGNFEGVLRDVIEHAVTLPKFWTWGAGGDFELIKVVKIDKNTNLLRQKKVDLQKQLAEIEKKLNEN
jgi:hypothetical protein